MMTALNDRHSNAAELATRMGIGRKASLRDIGRVMELANKGRELNPIEEGKADIVPWILYDRLYTAANTTTSTEYDFFTTPIGGTKTTVDTNLDQVSRLSDPQHFNTTSLQFYFSSRSNALDLGTFLDSYWCEFWIGQKIYAQGPLSQFPGGSGVSGFTTATNTSIYSNGLPSPNAVVDFRLGNNPIGHHILQGQTFKVKVLTAGSFPFTTSSITGAIGINLLCVLEGVLSRGVQ